MPRAHGEGDSCPALPYMVQFYCFKRRCQAWSCLLNLTIGTLHPPHAFVLSLVSSRRQTQPSTLAAHFSWALPRGIPQHQREGTAGHGGLEAVRNHRQKSQRGVSHHGTSPLRFRSAYSYQFPPPCFDSSLVHADAFTSTEGVSDGWDPYVTSRQPRDPEQGI